MCRSNTQYRCQCLACLDKPELDELRELYYAGPLALLNVLRPRPIDSPDRLDQLIAEQAPPPVSRGSLVAFVLIYVGCWSVFLGLLWLTAGFSAVVVLVTVITVLAVSSSRVLELFDKFDER